MTIASVVITILALRETVLSDLHASQHLESDQLQLIHVHERFITNGEDGQVGETSQIQNSETRIVRAVVANSDVSDRTIQRSNLALGAYGYALAI